MLVIESCTIDCVKLFPSGASHAISRSVTVSVPLTQLPNSAEELVEAQIF